jgi:hypothetical protein
VGGGVIFDANVAVVGQTALELAGSGGAGAVFLLFEELIKIGFPACVNLDPLVFGLLEG